ncbi:MAG TPA: PVC-type heme-binding CxxCH protein [Pirellulales bacterium]|jgi:putative membrane-bound dehydrogenase-like protein
MNAHLLRPLVLTVASMLFCFAVTLSLRAADPPPNADLKSELPRIKPVEPADAIGTFQVQPGYKIELIAAEPLVTDPVAMSFDAAGRLFVAEMIDYSEDAEANLGRIRLLTDVDGDGRFDKSTLYAETLSWPTALICYDGGIFVGAAPDIWYFKDTNGDGVAEVKKKIFTGFGRGNVQGLINSFAWGLDNRIHGATSSAGGTIRRVDETKGDNPAKELQQKGMSLSGRDFAFDPRTLELQPTSGGAQHGMCFDNWGRKFVCSNSDHIQQVMFEDRYVARNPFLAAPSPRLSIATDGPQAEVYRISPVEPWRIVRTRLRVSGQVPGLIEGGGRASGYFTGATGVTIYRGNAWPAAKTDNPQMTAAAEIAIVGDVGSNLIHRKLVVPHGVELVAARIDKESEFVASRDIWFRPVQYANSPDGSLCVADMYREVIEHPQSLPPAIKQHLDLTSGRDRGRIYRVVQDGFKQPKLPNLAKATTAELVATLANTNGWHRDTAARLLYERQDKAATPAIVKLAKEATLPEGRMHALYALAGMNALSPDVLLAALFDHHPGVRRHAVRLSEGLAKESAPIRQRWFDLAVIESDAESRYQLLFSLGEAPAGLSRDEALAALAKRGADDRWIRLALLSSLTDGVQRVFNQLVDDAQFRQTDGGKAVLTALAAQAGASGREADIARVLASVESLSGAEAGLAGQLVRGLGEGAARRGGSLEKLLATDATGKAAKILDQLIVEAQKTATDAERKPAERAAAVSVVALGPGDGALAVLRTLIDSRQPQEVQSAALAALARLNEKGVASVILEAWHTLSPRMRAQATEALFARTDRLQALLDAIEAGRFKPADVEPARAQQLQAHADPKIRERAGRLLTSVKLGRRQDVVAAHRDVLDMKGDPQRGKEHFKKVCAACHRVEGVGYEIGANLATFKNRGAEAILANVLDPNREVNPQYVSYTLLTDDGRTITGMIDSETAGSVTLRRAEGATDTVLRKNIEELVASGLSIMPEGLEQQLDKQALADLLAYLMSVQ